MFSTEDRKCSANCYVGINFCMVDSVKANHIGTGFQTDQIGIFKHHHTLKCQVNLAWVRYTIPALIFCVVGNPPWFVLFTVLFQFIDRHFFFQDEHLLCFLAVEMWCIFSHCP